MTRSNTRKSVVLHSTPMMGSVLILVLLIAGSHAANAQMTRKRANINGPVDEIFLSPTIVGIGSVTNLPKGNLNFTIMHVFGVVTNGIDDLYGLDAAANIRFGLDLGVTDRLSVGLGRSRFDKLYDFRFKVKLLRQTKDDRIPVEVAFKGDTGIMTVKNGFDLVDRLSYLSSLMIARRFSDQLSIQVSPMYSHFNTVFIERGADNTILRDKNDHLALAIAVRYALTKRTTLLIEFIPVLGDRSDATSNSFSIGYNIETGGHVFQLFFRTSRWLTEQHIMARNADRFFDGDFRFGFTINRVFSFSNPN